MPNYGEGNYDDAFDNAADIVDRHRWRNVDIDPADCGGKAVIQSDLLRPRQVVCPLSAKPSDQELEAKCCGCCNASRTGQCAGFNGQGPSPRRDVRIVWH